MPPIYEYLCGSCGHQFEDFVSVGEYSLKMGCPHCQHQADKLPSAHGGYKIKGDNSSSQRPKSAGSFKKGK
jgi:putative FmdB family regulatory protein